MWRFKKKREVVNLSYRSVVNKILIFTNLAISNLFELP